MERDAREVRHGAFEDRAHIPRRRLYDQCGILKLAGYADRTILPRLRAETIKECNLATEQLRKLGTFESEALLHIFEKLLSE
jgi:hypothetical protein